MLATLGQVPPDPQNFAYEFKWDGYRGLCFWDTKEMVFKTRNQLDISVECGVLIKTKPLSRTSFILDGEIVASDSSGEISFTMLQEHFGFRRKLRDKKPHPLIYVVFDILYLNGKWMTKLPYEERRRFLEKIPFKAPHWKFSPYQIGNPEKMLQIAKKNNIEGIIAKRLGSVYEMEKRSPNWIKIKIVKKQEFVIGGWMPVKKGDERGIGSLMLGFYKNKNSKYLNYVGNVGTGFDEDERYELKKFLAAHETKENPFGDAELPRQAHLSQPLAVAEVEFRGWTNDEKLRQGSFKGLRIDKNPKDVRKDA